MEARQDENTWKLEMDTTSEEKHQGSLNYQGDNFGLLSAAGLVGKLVHVDVQGVRSP